MASHGLLFLVVGFIGCVHSLRYGGDPKPKFGRRVALLLRGETFRKGTKLIGPAKTKGCTAKGERFQLLASRSVMEKIVRPLEKDGSTVDLFIGTAKCKMNDQLTPLITDNGRLNVSFNFYQSQSQGRNFGSLVDRFIKHHGDVFKAAETYDEIIITRLDVLWKKSIMEWPINTKKFNFAAPCWALRKAPCVSDVVHTMPGEMLPTFLGPAEMCYGHRCRPFVSPIIAKAHGKNTGYALGKEATRDPKTPWRQPRDPNDWYALPGMEETLQ